MDDNMIIEVYMMQAMNYIMLSLINHILKPYVQTHAIEYSLNQHIIQAYDNQYVITKCHSFLLHF